jgi:hypothetical protein
VCLCVGIGDGKGKQEQQGKLILRTMKKHWWIFLNGVTDKLTLKRTQTLVGQVIWSTAQPETRRSVRLLEQ